MCPILLLTCGVLALGAAAGEEPADAEKKLQGTWVAAMAQRDGKAAEDVIGHRLSFKGLRFEITSRTGKLLYQGTVSLHPDRKPPAIDFKHEGGELKGKVWKGIYALDDKALKICDNGPDPAKDRPTGFTAKEGSGHIVIVFKRKAKFTISKETTFVLGPVDKDGYIDYAAALNERLRQGVTPENNANVLLWQAFGPKPEGTPVSAEFFRLLGREAPPERGDYYVNLDRYMKVHLKIEHDAQINKLYDELDRTIARAWKAEQYPQIAGWVKLNESALAVICMASQRQRYFSPLVPAKRNMESSLLFTAADPGLRQCRDLANSLAVRAMLNLGNKQYEDAWRTLLACHRLARLVGDNASVLDAMVGHAAETIACQADISWLNGVPFDSKKLKHCLSELQQLSEMPGLAKNFIATERVVCLETMFMIERRGTSYLKHLLGPYIGDERAAGLLAPPSGKISREFVMDVALRRINQCLDRMVQSLVENRQLRKNRLAEIESELKASVEGEFEPSPTVPELFGRKTNAESRATRLANIFLSPFPTVLRSLQDKADYSKQAFYNLQIAFALAAYQRDHGRYPAKLEMLAPAYLPRVPGDIFSGKALIYRPTEKGYTLYSVGINERDDGGRSYQDDPRGDDLVVRMPLPNRK